MSSSGCGEVGDGVNLEEKSTVVDLAYLFWFEEVTLENRVHEVEISLALERYQEWVFDDQPGACFLEVGAHAGKEVCFQVW